MKRYRLTLIGIILIAWAVRLHNLAYHSLWFDEAISVYWARQSVPRILEVGFSLVEDRLPPLYYLLLKGWSGLVGFSETGVRSLSVVAGLLLIPVAANLAATLFNRRIALGTALLVALNPFLVWYAQEARMYALAALFGGLAVRAWLGVCLGRKQIPPPGRGRLGGGLSPLLFVLAATAGLYSHLYTGFLLPALGVWLILAYRRDWRLWLWFGLAGLLIGLAFSPIALATWRFSGEAMPGDPLSGLGGRAWELLQAFTVWKAPLSPDLRTAIPLAIILFGLAAYLPRRSGSRLPYPRLLVTLLFLAPFVIANLLLWRNYLAFFGERYFIAMVPWLLMLAATGAANLGNRFGRLRHLPLALLLMLTALPLPGLWSVPAAKEAWRQTVDYLAEQADPDHAILIHPDWVRYPFQYYFTGPGQTYAVFSDVTPRTDLDGPLQGVVADHPVVWLIQSHQEAPDPDRLVEQWFAARYPLVSELYPPGITLKGYAPGYQREELPPEATPVDLAFENGLRLVGYRAERRASATDLLFHPPSGWLHVILYWRADRPITAEVTPFVHLVGPEGVWGASLERANDALGLYPPHQWPPDGPLIRHDLDVNLNPATPPGLYQLILGLYESDTRHPLTTVELD